MIEQDEVLRMSREAGILSVWEEASTRQFELFASLVAAYALENDADLTIAYMKGGEDMKRRMEKRMQQLESQLQLCQTALAEQAEHDPVVWFVQYKNRHEFVFGNKPDFIIDGVVEPLYAAPVRTKDPCNPLQDLTDDEIEEIRMGIVAYEPTGYGRVFARAVIAADREKNK